MQSGLERDVKKSINPNTTSECCSPVACWLFLTQYKHLTNIMYSRALLCFNENANDIV